jgi:hypothetical protein
MADRRLTAALAGSAATSAAVAAHADAALSFGDTPPWHWVVHTDAIDLYANHAPRPRDTEGRLRLVRSGGAVHHVRVALAADGLAARVSLLPEPDVDPRHLARVTAGERIAVTAEAKALYEATEAGPAVSPGQPALVLDELARAVAAAGGVALALDRHVTGPDATGAEVLGVLYGDEDDASAWLHAGEALSATVLAANRHGLAVVASLVGAARGVPPAARAALRGLLAGIEHPYIALRIIQAPARGVPGGRAG